MGKDWNREISVPLYRSLLCKKGKFCFALISSRFFEDNMSFVVTCTTDYSPNYSTEYRQLIGLSRSKVVQKLF